MKHASITLPTASGAEISRDNVSAFEEDLYELLVQLLGGAEAVVNGGLVDVLVKSVVTFDLGGKKLYLSHEQQEPGDGVTTAILSAVFRTCILPFEGDHDSDNDKYRDYFINLNDEFPDYEFGTIKKKEYGGRYVSINLKWAINESIKTSSGICIMSRKDSDEMELEDPFSEASSLLSSNRVVENLLLEEEECALVKKLFPCKPLYKKKKQTNCTHHEDNRPSLMVTLTPYFWRLSKKINVEPSLESKLAKIYEMGFYECDDSIKNSFLFVSDNAVKDKNTGFVYILYKVSMNCMACEYRK